MASHPCKHCESWSPEEGWCITCGKPLGDLRKAWRAAWVTTSILGALWVGFTWLTGMQFPLFALVFGGLVSYCTTHFSAGRGILYQLIATGFTVLGIVAADSVAMMLLSAKEGDFDFASFTVDLLIEHMVYRAKYDSFTALFYVLGVMGGLWIWK